MGLHLLGQSRPIAAMAINYVRSFSAPAGTLTTEVAAATDAKPAPPPGAGIEKAAPPVADATRAPRRTIGQATTDADFESLLGAQADQQG